MKAGSEVTIGRPEFIEYSTAFSLLDGLFQDISAIQVSNLTGLSSNGSNATSVDAVLQ